MSPEPVAPSPMNSAMRDLAEVIYRRTGGRSVPTFELEPILARLYLAAKIEALQAAAKGVCECCDDPTVRLFAESGDWWHTCEAWGEQLEFCLAGPIHDTLAKLREEAK